MKEKKDFEDEDEIPPTPPMTENFELLTQPLTESDEEWFRVRACKGERASAAAKNLGHCASDEGLMDPPGEGHREHSSDEGLVGPPGEGSSL